MSSILQTAVQSPLSQPRQFSVSLVTSFLEILTHRSSCVLNSKRAQMTLGRKKHDFISCSLQDPSQGLTPCFRRKIEDIRKVGWRRNRENGFAPSSLWLHVNAFLPPSICFQSEHFSRCESFRRWLQVDFLSLTNNCRSRNAGYCKQARSELFVKLPCF